MTKIPSVRDFTFSAKIKRKLLAWNFQNTETRKEVKVKKKERKKRKENLRKKFKKARKKDGSPRYTRRGDDVQSDMGRYRHDELL
tara:strand:+ start:924 stop:1178 length:255 start_codon:yes stop_codon:yes gene_type:complete